VNDAREALQAAPSWSTRSGGASSADRYVVGIDFGTLSARAVVVRVSDGAELGTGVHDYSHGVLSESLPRELAGREVPLGPQWALQVPEDYRQALHRVVRPALESAGVDASSVVGLGTDFTACTMVPTLTDGTPLCELATYRHRPHAYVKLWKHHAAQTQADRITDVALRRGEPWLPRYGGRISSEWEFAKALQVLEEDPNVYDAIERWVEAADWIVWQLTGTYVRNTCAAGYKGLLQDGEYPSSDFLHDLHPSFSDFVTTKLAQPLGRPGQVAGLLSAQASTWTGLPAGIPVAVGNVDAHVTAAAAAATGSGQMVAIMGTSTCLVMNSARLREVPGMCGVVRGGIVEGQWGYEAGQSGVGDILAHFVDSSMPPAYRAAADAANVSPHDYLSDLAARQGPGEHGLVALDWHSGNRSVLVDHELSGLIVGLTLATRPEDIYRALVEATAFGARTIVEAFAAAGVPVAELVVTGGLVKNSFVMQTYSDVLRMPLSLIASEQGPALGAAIHAAVAAGEYCDVPTAAQAMGRRTRHAYRPVPAASAAYDRLFAAYSRLHDHFGRGGDLVMHELAALRRDALVTQSAAVR
jgi:L-ribulokinase